MVTAKCRIFLYQENLWNGTNNTRIEFLDFVTFNIYSKGSSSEMHTLGPMCSEPRPNICSFNPPVNSDGCICTFIICNHPSLFRSVIWPIHWELGRAAHGFGKQFALLLYFVIAIQCYFSPIPLPVPYLMYSVVILPLFPVAKCTWGFV